MNSFLGTVFPLSIVGVSGFVFLRTWLATRALHRLEPVGLYSFWVAAAGLVLWFLCIFLVVLLEQLWVPIDCFLVAQNPCRLTFSPVYLQPSPIQWNIAAILSVPASIVSVVLLGQGSGRVLSRRILGAILLQDLESTALGRVAKACSRQGADFPISLTLDTGHVIIGYPISPESFANSSPDVDVLPFASGYRDDQERLHLTTSYRWIYELSREQQETFTKAITRARIVSANVFDEEKWLRFNKRGKPKAGPTQVGKSEEG